MEWNSKAKSDGEAEMAYIFSIEFIYFVQKVTWFILRKLFLAVEEPNLRVTE